MEEKEIHLCECGCLQPTKLGNRFINNHHGRGKPGGGGRPKGSKNKNPTKSGKDRKPGSGVFKRTPEMKTGGWNRGLTKENNLGVASQAAKMTGRKHTFEHITAQSVGQIKRYEDPKEHEKTKEALARPDVKAKMSGPNNGAYIDGLSNTYHPNFTPVFCKEIRDLHNNKCDICGKTNVENINETTKCLCVHHIFYDPETNDCSNPEDFISLCSSCHCMTTVGNHEYWTNYFIMQKLLVA